MRLCIKKKKYGNTEHPNRKGGSQVKVSLFVDMILYLENPIVLTQKLFPADTQLQQNFRIQNHCTKITSISVHQ